MGKTSSTGGAPALTLAALLGTVERLQMTVWYATHNTMEPGRVLRIPASGEAIGLPTPEWYMLHPDSLPALQAQLGPGVRWRHIREHVPTPTPRPDPVPYVADDPERLRLRP